VSNVLHRKNFTEPQIRNVIHGMLSLCHLTRLSEAVCLSASRLREARSLSFWDSQIVASAIASGCNILATEDMQDQLLIDGTRITNIFR
jgi:predicted nucleic acid-binding protein